MKIPTRFTYAVGGIALFLAGCNNGAPSSPGIPSASSHLHPHLRWAAADIGRPPRLLFLSDSSSGSVYIYSMPDMTMKAQLSGWTDLQGECADTKGNVYIVDAEARYLSELDRSGEEHGNLRDEDGTPLSCAVNPTNGDVAATSNGASGAGEIMIFPGGGSGSGTPVRVPHMYTYFFDGYDKSGNLWVDGYAKNSTSILASCRGSSCKTIRITGGTIFYPGFIQYAVNRKTWYVADRQCGGAKRFCIYPVSARGVLGKKITLTDAHGKPVCDMFQGAITEAASTVFVGGVANGLAKCGVNSVARWNFPAGGDSTYGNDDVGSSPTGAAISAKYGGFPAGRNSP